MELIPSSLNTCGLFVCLKILLCDINGFFSILFYCLQCLWNWKRCINSRSFSNPKPLKQNLNCINQHGVTLCKEDVITVMEKLGMNVERCGSGIEDFGEQEISEMFENEASMAEVEEAFDVFDENKDGFIDAAELQRVLCCLGLEKDFTECQKMINAVDQNGDKLIDHNEFLMLMEQSFG
ncbi:hypothetical protein VNO77_04459 [Canavalia gladiata]|uniref:EF-hand domain-containing protein n=1 Tax=Canavalia gladiata TaxID=3824 RepID=A0AAN9N327_CANGL